MVRTYLSLGYFQTLNNLLWIIHLMSDMTLWSYDHVFSWLFCEQSTFPNDLTVWNIHSYIFNSILESECLQYFRRISGGISAHQDVPCILLPWKEHKTSTTWSQRFRCKRYRLCVFTDIIFGYNMFDIICYMLTCYSSVDGYAFGFCGWLEHSNLIGTGECVHIIVYMDPRSKG